MWIYVRLVAATLRRVARARSDLLLENLALRQQLAMYKRQPAWGGKTPSEPHGPLGASVQFSTPIGR